MTTNELRTLDRLVDELLEQHHRFETKLQEDILHINEGIQEQLKSTNQRIPEFRFGPVKGKPRALTKIKEDIKKNDFYKKFPLENLKDTSRASYVFNNANEQLNFIDKFIGIINSSKKFEIFQIKNMFSEVGLTQKKINENKYSYKDIKFILAYKVNEDIVLTMEIQFILRPILDMKCILHYF